MIGSKEGSELEAVERCRARSLFASRGLPKVPRPARGFNNPDDGIVWLGRGETLAVVGPEEERIGSCKEEVRGGTTVAFVSSVTFLPSFVAPSCEDRSDGGASSVLRRYASCRAGVEGSCNSKVAPGVDSN